MSKSSDNNNKRKPWEFKGQVPPGDNPDITEHLTESAVNNLVATLRDTVTMVTVHEDMAPITAGMVMELCRAVTGDVVRFVRQWPK